MQQNLKALATRAQASIYGLSARLSCPSGTRERKRHRDSERGASVVELILLTAAVVGLVVVLFKTVTRESQSIVDQAFQLIKDLLG